jgi:hypothetical protein
VIIEKMRARLRAFAALLADEPDSPQADQALHLFEQGWSINQVVAKLAPDLGGPLMRRAQVAVEHQARVTLHQQAAIAKAQREEIAELREYIEGLHRYIAQLETALVQRGGA